MQPTAQQNPQKVQNQPQDSPVYKKTKKNDGIVYAIIAVVIMLMFVSISGLISLAMQSGETDLDGMLSYFRKNTELAKNADYETNFVGEIASTCGYVVGRPETNDPQTNEQWFYEAITLAPSNFRDLVPESATANGVVGVSMLYKTNEQKFVSTNSYTYGQPGILTWCIDDTLGWSLEEHKEYIQNLDDSELTYTFEEEYAKFGEYDALPFWREGVINTGEYVKEPLYLLKTNEGDYGRIVLLQSWGTDNVVLAKDTEAILQSLKPREDLNTTVQFPEFGFFTPTSLNNNNSQQNTQQAQEPSCIRYQIREGEFASDKCYTQDDYNDLVYYIGRYNSATFSYNAAASRYDIVCSGSEFFESSCDQTKDQLEQAEDDRDEYAGIIRDIIARGQ